jgi:DNA polymerase-3 subunit epsilon
MSAISGDFQAYLNSAAGLRAAIAKLEETGQFRVLRRMMSLPRTGTTNGPTAMVVVIDTETTGLNPETDKVIDIGVVKLEVDAATGDFIRVVDTWDSLEDPHEPIDPMITELTHITDDMVRGRAFNEAELIALMKDVSLVVAHGALHDRRFLEKRFPWFENFAWGCSLDQVGWSREGFGSAKLEFVAFKCGYYYDAHRALADSHALARCIVDCVLPSTGAPVLRSLIASCAERDYRVFANGAPFESKDMLRARGYRWDGEKKLWHRTMRGADAMHEELDWMHGMLYERSARVQVEVIDSYVKYSGRPGELEWKSIGSRGDSMRAAAEGLSGGGSRSFL